MEAEPQKKKTLGDHVFTWFVSMSLLGIALIICGGIVTSVNKHIDKRNAARNAAPAVAAPKPPPPPPKDLKRDYARDLAQDMVSKMLRAPATARWVVTDVVAEQSPHYIVHVVVDAQNAFGGEVRDSYLTALEVVDSSNYKRKPYSSVIRCRNPPSKDEIWQMKNANWPEELAVAE